MAAPMEHMDTLEEKVVFPLKSGASLVQVRPVFSHDNKCLCVCSGCIVKVYSTVTGDCIQELTGHTDVITGIVIHPKNKLQLVSCSLDQSIIIWDYKDGVLLKQLRLTNKLHAIYTGEENVGVVYVLRQALQSECELVRMSLSLHTTKEPEVILKKCKMNSRQTAVGPKGKFCVSVSKSSMTIRVDDNGYKYAPIWHSKPKEHKFTSIACHPGGKCIATGCSDGRIMLWYNFLQKDELVNTTLHWHSLAVGDLCYTLEGSYLLSGGQECVLVKWHPETKYQDFLPRLGASINYIVCSKDNLMYAVCHTDNVIQVISSSLSIEQVFQGLTRDHLVQGHNQEPVPTGLQCDPRTQALVMNGKPGHVQFYSVHEDKQLYNIDIVGQNYVSPENTSKPLTVTQVTKVTFDTTGSWMVTAEYWNDGVMSPEIRLKFWCFVDKTQSYTLNTVVELAHTQQIGSLLMRPQSNTSSPGTEHMAVTSSTDGKFKIWMLVDDTDIYRHNNKWTCESVGFYRDLPAGDTTFSEDGSLLGVVFGSYITLWDPENNQLKQTLMCNMSQEPVRQITFGRESCSQYLVSCTATTLTVWSLISCAAHWSVDTSVVCIASNPRTEVMAAFTHNKELFVFKPSDHAPIFTNAAVSKSPIVSAVFIPHSKKNLYEKTTLDWQSQSELFFLNKDQELLSVSLATDSKTLKTKENLVTFEQNLPQTALSLIMSRHTNTSGSKVNKTLVAKQPDGKYIQEIFSSAAHVQPSVSVLCKPFIQSLLLGSAKHRLNLGKHNDDDDTDTEELDQPQVQTGSQDSGVDSDMEMEISESQSRDIYSNTKTDSNIDTENCKTKIEEKLESEFSKVVNTKPKITAVDKEILKETDLKVLGSNLDWYTQT